MCIFRALVSWLHPANGCWPRALEVFATAMIPVHNQPSGDPSPSRADVEMTKQIVKAARALGISLHDHIIVGRPGHASFKVLGLI